MLRLLAFSMFICVAVDCHAQVFHYNRDGKVISLNTDFSKAVFSPYKRVSEGVSERKVTWNGINYTFTKWMSGTGEIEVVRDSTKRLLATTYLDGKSRNNITLPDGKTLVWVENQNTFTYTLENSNIVTSTVDNKGPLKKVDLQIANRDQTSDATVLLLMERSTEHLKSGSGKYVWIGLAVMAGAATIIGSLAQPDTDVQ